MSRRVLVTGSSRGIGRAIAQAFAEQGDRVAVHYVRSEDRASAVVDELPGDGHVVVQADLADAEAVRRMVDSAAEQLGGLDVLVNNAAIPKRRDVRALTDDEIDETMRINYTSPVRMSRALLPGMLERGRGCIVNVTSLAGRLGVKHEAAYSASKFALTGFTEAMAIDLWDTPVEIRLVLPGAIDTEIWDLPGNDDPIYDGPKEPPESVAEGIIAAIEGTAFEHYLPDMKGVVEWKTSSVDEFLGGVAAL